MILKKSYLGGGLNSVAIKTYEIAKNGGKHAKMLSDYSNKPIKEIQNGIKSYEKQIAIHKDKIASSSKYCPDWDKLDIYRS